MKLASVKYAVLLMVLVLLVGAGVSGQTLERGAIRGTVYDASKSAIPGAKLTLTQTSTSLKREVTSNELGAYTFDGVTPGEYILVVEAPSFATYTVKNIVVNVGASIGL